MNMPYITRTSTVLSRPLRSRWGMERYLAISGFMPLRSIRAGRLMERWEMPGIAANRGRSPRRPIRSPGARKHLHRIRTRTRSGGVRCIISDSTLTIRRISQVRPSAFTKREPRSTLRCSPQVPSPDRQLQRRQLLRPHHLHSHLRQPQRRVEAIHRR